MTHSGFTRETNTFIRNTAHSSNYSISQFESCGSSNDLLGFSQTTVSEQHGAKTQKLSSEHLQHAQVGSECGINCMNSFNSSNWC